DSLQKVPATRFAEPSRSTSRAGAVGGSGKSNANGASAAELSLYCLGVDQVVHLVEAPVTDLVEGVLGQLQGGAGGGHAEPFLRACALVEQPGRPAVTVDGDVLDPPGEVRHRIAVRLQFRDDVVPRDRLAVLDELVVNELGHAVKVVSVKRID